MDKKKYRQTNGKVFFRWQLASKHEFFPRGLCECWWRPIGCWGIMKFWCDVECERHCYKTECVSYHRIERTKGCQIEEKQERVSCLFDPTKREKTDGQGSPCLCQPPSK